MIVLGNEFETDIALFRFHLGGSVVMPPGSTVAKIVLTTVAEALAAAAAKVLDIEESDIGAEFRVAMTSGGRTGRDVEVYLYDLTPGGAGFVRSAVAHPDRLFDEALARLESCRCTHSCYECLRSYKNKWDHKYLDRKLGAAFLRYVVRGEPPTIVEDDEERLLRALRVDLEESGHEVVTLDGGLRLPRLADRVVVLGHPMTHGAAGTARGRGLVEQAAQYVVVDQLLIDRALPAAVKTSTGALVTEGNAVGLPTFLRESDEGIPVFSLSSLNAPEGPRPIAKVAVQGAPPNAFVVQLTRSTIEKGIAALSTGAWVVFSSAEPADYAASVRGAAPRLLRSVGVGFNATKEGWTFGFALLQGNKVKIQYRSEVAPPYEAARVEDVAVVGRAIGVFVDGQLQPLVGN